MALVSYWRMNDNAASTTVIDSEGTNNGAAAANTNTKSVTGIVDRALSFNGSSDIITVSYDSSLNLTTSFSVAMWFWYTGTDEALFDKTIGGVTNEQFLAYVDINNKVLFRTVKGDANQDLVCTTALSAGSFQHVVCTWDGTTMKVFVNTVQDATTKAVASPIDGGEGDFFLGCLQGDTYLVEGKIDEARIYSHALSTSEITQLYKLRAGGKAMMFSGGVAVG